MKKLKTFGHRLRKDIVQHKGLYVLLLLVVIYFLIFHYYPMYGAQIAFRNFAPKKGIWGSMWVGLKHFRRFFDSVFAERLIGNTLKINLKNLLFGFPAPIILALMLNEVSSVRFKRTIQTITYLPHFISTVVIAGMIHQFVGSDGFITQLLQSFGYEGKNLLYDPKMFQPIYVISDIWQSVGWGSIVYIAAIAGVDAELYEAARIDGASRWHQMLHITLPGIMPTIITMFILRIGSMMSLGSEKIILLYNESIYETADVISSYVYRIGLVEQNYSFAAAVGLFNSVINTILVLSFNKISKKITGWGLW